jgi:xanthine dehydrogenase accessory factor
MSDESDILRIARDWLSQGKQLALATVVRTWGSAPRGVGSHLIICDDGRFEGSVSGGCVEAAVIEAARLAMADGKPQRLTFGISDAMAWEVGLACGGQIEILLQPKIEIALLDSIIATVAAGRTCQMITDMSSGRSQFSEDSAANSALGDTHFVRVYEPKLRLAVVGAVHIAQALVPMAAQLGYEVLLIDPRTAFTSSEHFNSAQVSNDWPDEALRNWTLTPRSALVTLTHDPKLDDPALEAALASPAFYIAALGSKKTHAARCERLREKGFSDEAIARIHGPAGLHIGAKSPAEIALSVMAQMTSILRKSPV